MLTEGSRSPPNTPSPYWNFFISLLVGFLVCSSFDIETVWSTSPHLPQTSTDNKNTEYHIGNILMWFRVINFPWQTYVENLAFNFISELLNCFHLARSVMNWRVSCSNGFLFILLLRSKSLMTLWCFFAVIGPRKKGNVPWRISGLAGLQFSSQPPWRPEVRKALLLLLHCRNIFQPCFVKSVFYFLLFKVHISSFYCRGRCGSILFNSSGVNLCIMIISFIKKYSIVVEPRNIQWVM